MLFSTALLAGFLALGSAAPSNPKVLTFPVTKHHKESDLVEHHLQQLNKGNNPDPVLITNQFNYYSIALSLGTPAQEFNLLLDTGSSDLWVFNASDTTNCVANACQGTGEFNSSLSSTYHSLDENYLIQYVSGNASGTWGTDTLSVSEVTLPDFRFATADHAVGNTGVLGISVPGSESLHKGEAPYANFPIALQDAGYIDRRVYSLYLNESSSDNGTFLLGGIDYAKFNGSLTVLPMASPYAFYVNYTGINLDGKTVAKPGAAVLDSGTTYTYIPDEAYQVIAKKLNLEPFFFGPSVIDCDTKLSLDFNFNGVTINAEQMFINTGIGMCFLGIQSSRLSDNITIFGDTFLRNAYVAYDLEDSQIGIAQAVYTEKTDIRPVTGPL